ncbi:MAG: translocation/assembly module TamB domain-containing protein [bacterium]
MSAKSVIRSLAILLGSCALVLGSVLVILALVTQTASFRNWLSGVLARNAREKFGLALSVRRIGGNLVTGLVLEEVELRDPKGEHLSLGEMKVRFSPLALLTRQMTFPRVALSRLHLTIIRTEEGGIRVLPLPGRPSPPSPTGAGFPLLDFRIQRLLIQDGYVTFRDYFQKKSPIEISGQGIQADLSLGLYLRPGAGDWDARVRNLSFRVSPWQLAVNKVRGDVSSRQGVLDISGLEVMSAPAQIWLQGRVNLAAGQRDVPFFDLRGRLSRISLPELEAILARGGVPGQFPPALLRLSDLEGEGRVRGTLSDLDYSFLLSFEADRQKGQWQSGGNLDLSDPGFPRYRLRTGIRRFPVSWWLPEKKRSAFSRYLDLHARIRGEGIRPDEISAEIEADISPFTLFGQSVTAAGFSAQLDGRKLRLANLEVNGPAGRVRLEGEADLRPPFLYRADISFQQVNLARIQGLPARLVRESRLAGDAMLQGSVGTGFPKNFQAAGSVRLFPSWIENRFVDNLTLQGDFAAGTVHLSQGKITADGLALTLRGTASRQKLHLIWNLSELDFSRAGIDRLADLSAGVVSGHGKITGSWQQPELAGEFTGRDITYRGYHASNIALKGRAGGGRSFQALNFDARIQAASLWHEQQKFQDSLSIQARKEGPKITWQVRGTRQVNRVYQARGVADILQPFQVSVRVDEASFPLEESIWRNIEPIRVELDADKNVRILSLRLGSGQRYFAAQGEIRRTGQQKMQIQVSGFPVQEIGKWTGRTASSLGSLSGTLEGEVNLAGTRISPEMSGKLEVIKGRWSTFSFNRLHQEFTYSQKKLNITASLAQAEKEILHLEGMVPVDLSFRSVPDRWSRSGLELRIRLQEVDLSVIPSFLPALAEVKGAVSGTGSMTGSLRDPRFEGSVGFVRTSFRIKPLLQVFQVRSALIRGNSQRITFEDVDLAGKSGAGRLSAAVELSGFTVRSITARIRADKWKILYSRTTYFVFNGELSAQGNLSRIAVAGRMSIPEGKARLSDFAFGKKSSSEIQVIRGKEDEMKLVEKKAAFFKPNVSMSVTVSIPRNFWVSGEQTNIELKGELGIHKTFGQDPAIAGSIESIRGTYEFYGKEFTIRRANIQFQGLPEINPLIDMETVYRVGETNIYILISGTRKAPVVRLQSDDPTLSQDQIISLLVFGQQLENLNQREAASLQGEAFALLGRVVATQVLGIFGEKLPVDTVQIRASKEGISTLEVGKYLTRNVFVSFGKEFGQEKGAEQVVVEYYLYSNLTLEAEIRNDQNSSVDLIWKKDF